MPLRATALNCTLNASPAESSTELLAQQVLDALARHDVTGSVVRVVDHDVRPGVELDMGDGDEWPGIRETIMASDILVLATPTWLGQHSSVCQRVLERLDAELSEKDDEGRLRTYGKVAVAVVVGNEDGAQPRQRRALPVAQRRRVHDPRRWRHVLERRGHARHRLQGPRVHARDRRKHDGDAGRPCGAPREDACGSALPAVVTVVVDVFEGVDALVASVLVASVHE